MDIIESAAVRMAHDALADPATAARAARIIEDMNSAVTDAFNQLHALLTDGADSDHAKRVATDVVRDTLMTGVTEVTRERRSVLAPPYPGATCDEGPERA